MSLVQNWSATGAHKPNNTFSRKALGAAIGLVLSANALAGFLTLYGKLQLIAGQYDFEKLEFPLTAPGGSTYATLGAPTTLSNTPHGLNPLSEWDGAAGTATYKENGVWKIAGPWSAKFQLAKSTSTPSNNAYEDVDLEAVVVGVDYALNEATRVFSYYAKVETKGDAVISTRAVTDSVLTVGLDFRF